MGLSVPYANFFLDKKLLQNAWGMHALVMNPNEILVFILFLSLAYYYIC